MKEWEKEERKKKRESERVMSMENIKKRAEILFLAMEKRKIVWVLSYTVLFLILYFLMFLNFFISKTSFIWEIDGYPQHYTNLMYIRNYAVNFLKRGILATYDFDLGFGGNPFNVLTYYGIFDPINFVAAFIPLRYIEYLYGILIAFRVYLGGITFGIMCIYFGKKRGYSLLGSLVYISSSYVIYHGVRHPFFLNPFIYLPLILMGIDKILKRQKPYWFIFGVSFSALSGFYFLYMMTIMAFIFASLRFFEINKGKIGLIKEYIAVFFRAMAYYLLGIGASAIVFLPHLIDYLGSSRSGVKENLFYLKEFSYFKNMFFVFSAKTSSLRMGISFLAFFSIALGMTYYSKTRKMFALLLVAALIGHGISWIGTVFNGFSYPTNRWMFGTLLLLSYIFVDMLPKFLEHREFKWVTAFLIAYDIPFLLFRDEIKSDIFYGSLIIHVIYLCFYLLPILLERMKNIQMDKRILTLGIVPVLLFSAFVMGNKTHVINQDERVEGFRAYGNYQVHQKTQEGQYAKYTKKHKDKGFYRVNGSSLYPNKGMIFGVKTPAVYWSIMNGNIERFFSELMIAQQESRITFKGLDGRTILNTLTSGKYFLAREGETGEVPYGYKEIARLNNNILYKNKYFLPFGFTYDSYMSYDEVQKLNSVDKEAVMLDGVVLEEEREGFQKIKPNIYSEEMSYEIKEEDRALFKEEGFIDLRHIREQEPRKVELNFELEKDKEGYLYFQDLILPDEPVGSNLKVFGDDINKKSYMRSRRSEAYFYKTNYLFNIGNVRKNRKKITFSSDYSEIYPLKDIRMYCLDMKGYADKVKKLKKDCLKKVKFGKNKITGEIVLEKPKILALSIPYERGWIAYVDGEKAEILRGNYMFSCLALEAGEHKIEMRYHTPGLKEAAFVSGICLIILGIIILGDRRRKKNVSIGNCALL